MRYYYIKAKKSDTEKKMLLHENKEVRQRPEEGYRRWFVNDYFDIILWYDHEGGELTGFQVCFSKNKDERAFSWQKNEYASSHYVSDPVRETGTSGLATNILYGYAGIIPGETIRRLKDEKGELDDEILSLILESIETYNGKQRNGSLSGDDNIDDYHFI